MKDNKKIKERAYEFAIDIIKFVRKLPKDTAGFVVGRQLLKSGTSIGANVREAQNAESKADFIHKMKVAAKEAEETEYWLLLCQLSNSYPDCQDLQNKIADILKILSKIISSSKK